MTLTIALLTITAVLLGLVLIGSIGENQAYAGAAALGGRYMMVNGEHGTYMDFIYVIDVFDQTLNVYVYNYKTQKLELADQVDLAKAFRTPTRIN